MFEFIDKKDPAQTHSQSLNITYPRTINILFGNYPIVEDLLNMTVEIKQKILEEESYKTNVKGGKTGWKVFCDHSFTKKFIDWCVLKHQPTHPHIFKNFYSNNRVTNAWGNEIKKGDYIQYHIHTSLHCILYLTKGEPLIFPELNLKINPNPGDYYFFPPEILHGMETSTSEQPRYSFVMNIEAVKEWDKLTFKKEKPIN